MSDKLPTSFIHRLNPSKFSPVHEIYLQHIDEIHKWILTRKLIIHGAAAVDMRLKAKALPNGPIDCYGKDDEIEALKKSFSAHEGYTTTHIKVSHQLSCMIKGVPVVIVTLFPEDVTIPVEVLGGYSLLALDYTVSIYWSLLNGHQLMLYNARLEKDYNNLLNVAKYLMEKKAMPEPYKVLEKPTLPDKQSIDIKQLPNCWYSGEYALSILEGKKFDAKGHVDIASFGKPTEIVDILVSKMDFEQKDYVLSFNWGLLPSYFVLTGKDYTVRVLDCSTFTGRGYKDLNTLALLSIAAFHPGDIAIRALASLQANDAAPAFMGDTKIGKGIANTVLKEVASKTEIDRMLYTTNIEFLSIATAKLILTGD